MAIGDDKRFFMTYRNLQMARYGEQPEITPLRPSKKNSLLPPNLFGFRLNPQAKIH